MERILTRLFFILGCALAATATERVLMNELVDQKVHTLNDRLPARAPIAFDILSPPHIELHDGYFTGLNTLYRSKDNVMMMFDNGTFHYDFHAGFQKFIAEYDNAKINNVPISGVIRAKKSSFRIAFSAMVNLGTNECEVDLEYFGLESLDKVSITDRDGKVKDITDVVVEHALPKINEELNKPAFRDAFMNGLKSGFCKKIRQMFGLSQTEGRLKRSPSYVEQLTSLIAGDFVPHKLR